VVTLAATVDPLTPALSPVPGARGKFLLLSRVWERVGW
jgi:hypothetical protein